MFSQCWEKPFGLSTTADKVSYKCASLQEKTHYLTLVGKHAKQQIQETLKFKVGDVSNLKCLLLSNNNSSSNDININDNSSNNDNPDRYTRAGGHGLPAPCIVKLSDLILILNE